MHEAIEQTVAVRIEVAGNKDGDDEGVDCNDTCKTMVLASTNGRKTNRHSVCKAKAARVHMRHIAELPSRTKSSALWSFTNRTQDVRSWQ
jgi:hypothetical protein